MNSMSHMTVAGGLLFCANVLFGHKQGFPRIRWSISGVVEAGDVRVKTPETSSVLWVTNNWEQ